MPSECSHAYTRRCKSRWRKRRRIGVRRLQTYCPNAKRRSGSCPAVSGTLHCRHSGCLVPWCGAFVATVSYGILCVWRLGKTKMEMLLFQLSFWLHLFRVAANSERNAILFELVCLAFSLVLPVGFFICKCSLQCSSCSLQGAFLHVLAFIGIAIVFALALAFTFEFALALAFGLTLSIRGQ